MRPATSLSGRSRRLTLLGLLAILAVLVLFPETVFPQSNDRDDARNRLCGEVYGCTTSDCWVHHRPEGMRDAFIINPILPVQLAQNEIAEVEFQIINPWKNDLRNLSVNVSMVSEEGDEQRVFVPGASSGAGGGPQNYLQTYQDTYEFTDPGLQPDNVPPENNTFDIQGLPTAIFIEANLTFRDVPGADAAGYASGVEMALRSQRITAGIPFQPDDDPRSIRRTLVLEGDEAGANLRTLSSDGEGWIQINWAPGNAYGNEVDYVIRVSVLYSAGGAVQTYQIASVDSSITIPPGSSEVFTFPLQGIRAGNQTIEIEVKAATYYALTHKDGVTYDEDTYTRYVKREITVGQTFIPSTSAVAAVSGPQDDIRLVMGEVTGFAGAILLLPSLLFGGTFGKTSRKISNTILGGAKRRVMFHNLLSLGLTIAAVVHIIMFTLEIRYTILFGLLWGGFAALSLLVLGLTGYYQVPLIQRYGYKFWRYSHLSFGILVVLFTGYHSIAEGPDFFFIREQLPDWLNRVNLAIK